jgi:hypothetical protein
MPVLSERQIQYNKDLNYFYNKACKTMDDSSFPDEDKEKWVPKFRTLLDGLNQSVSDIEQELGRKMTEDEILKGFKGA